MTAVIPPLIRPRVTLDDIRKSLATANVVLTEARLAMLTPKPRKAAPTFTSSEVAALCGINRKQLNYLCGVEGNGLPRGTMNSPRGKRTFSLAEARAWVRGVNSSIFPRPAGSDGKVIAVTGFKGGSSKTTTAMHLAQGLSLRHGRRVLLIDLDSQSSATVMCDFLPEKEVTETDTILPYFFDTDEFPDLRYAVRDTYWDGLSLIPATFDLYTLEVQLPIQAVEDPTYDFWSRLEEGLRPLRQDFDVIVVDCPPSLSYLTFNAVFAADALVVPMPPEGLDYASSVMFWRLFTDLFGLLEKRAARNHKTIAKEYDFISVLPSKVNEAAPGYETVMDWVRDSYGKWVSTIEVPLSQATANKGVEFSSVYDISRGDQDMRSVERIRSRTNEFVQWVDQRLVESWIRETGQ
jgi:chromosome partitioning protein